MSSALVTADDFAAALDDVGATVTVYTRPTTGTADDYGDANIGTLSTWTNTSAKCIPIAEAPADHAFGAEGSIEGMFMETINVMYFKSTQAVNYLDVVLLGSDYYVVSAVHDNYANGLIAYRTARVRKMAGT